MPLTHEDDAATVLASLLLTVADLPVAVVIDRVVLDSLGQVEDIVTEYANLEAAQLFGLTGSIHDSGLLGLSVSETLPARAAAQSIDVADAVWRTGHTARGTWHLEGSGPLNVAFTRVKVEPCFLLGYFEPVSDIEAAADQRQSTSIALADVLNASADGFLIIDESRSRPHARTATIDFANDAAGAIFPELLAQNLVDPSTPVGRALTDLLNQAHGIRAAVGGEWSVTSGTGIVTLDMRTKPLADGRRVVTFRDITLKDRLRRNASEATAQALTSRAMLFAALDSLPMPVGVCESVSDAAGNVGMRMRFRNAEALRRSANIRPDADISVEEALPGLVSAGVVDTMFDVLRDGTPARCSVTLESEGDTVVHYDLIISRVGSASVILVGFDVSEDRQIRADLATARDQALALIEERAEFTAAMTHELRTPLTTVISAGELLLASPLDAAQRGFADQQVTASRHLLSVINDSLDIHSLGEGPATLEDVDFRVGELLAAVETITTRQAAERQTTVRYVVADSVPAVLRGDGFRLERALLNLVSNAIKFTPDGTVAVRLEAEHIRGDEWELFAEVADDGDGIAAAALPTIFAPFQQASGSTRRTHGGSGLGLALVKQTVERMNGLLWVESGLGAGSTFRFTVRLHMPRADAETEASKAIDPASDAATYARVLLVEDEDVNRILLTALLEREGLVVDSVDNGLDAVAAALTGHYDIVFMDVRMPVVNGFEATRRIRRTLSPAKLPVVALTASPTPEIRADAGAAGMQATLGKPVDIARLLGVVHDLLPPQGAEVPTRP